MEEVVYKVRQFFDEGKAYLTKETPFKDRHPFSQTTGGIPKNKRKVPIIEFL